MSDLVAFDEGRVLKYTRVTGYLTEVQRLQIDLNHLVLVLISILGDQKDEIRVRSELLEELVKSDDASIRVQLIDNELVIKLERRHDG